jgi:phosphocarrier protein HPr
MAGEVLEKVMTIKNERGLHVRLATKLVQLTSKYPCEITIRKDTHEVNGKSIMGILMLVAPRGTSVTVRAKGDRAAEAIDAIAKLINEFGDQ